MKIAFVTLAYFEPQAPSSSLSIWITNIASRLVKNHEIVVYSPKDYGQKKTEKFRGVKYRHISAGFDRILGNVIEGAIKRFHRKTNKKRPYFASTLYSFTFILKVAMDLRTQKIDIVHIHEESAFISVIRALNPKIKIVLHMHNEWLTQLDHGMIENRIKKADLILGCSHYITNRISQSFPSLAGRCKPLYNGVDLSRFINNPANIEKKHDSKKVLFVSRVSPEKGLHILIESFKEVVEKEPNARLEIVGDLNGMMPFDDLMLSEDPKVQKLATFYGKEGKGPSSSYSDYLTKRLLSLNISENVTFVGQVPSEQVAKFYQTADLFVFPSICNEPFGMGIIEAMACKLPVVGTRAGGIPEIIEDGKTGFLVEPEDIRALSKAILDLLSNENLRIQMGAIAEKRVGSFSWDNIVKNLLCLYEDMDNQAI
jgi:glycosyltransferase involved in cell wall biosynthesis